MPGSVVLAAVSGAGKAEFVRSLGDDRPAGDVEHGHAPAAA
ncbi:hypothetical protein ACFQ08_11255 [Streptosporangium algeriense]|uniref:Uncharacterized protein n=1 Tax=Streptosporangium algeriense TaxID=1682748 RepID=A0ABW3DPV2_9ACTN